MFTLWKRYRFIHPELFSNPFSNKQKDPPEHPEEGMSCAERRKRRDVYGSERWPSGWPTFLGPEPRRKKRAIAHEETR